MSDFFKTPPPLRPIDRTAHRVTRKADHEDKWDPIRKRHDDGWRGIEPMLQAAERPAHVPDFCGIVRGRLAAHSYHAWDRKHKQHLWRMRCACGTFVLRKMDRWLAFPDRIDCCDRCDEAHFVRTGAYLAIKGERALGEAPMRWVIGRDRTELLLGGQVLATVYPTAHAGVRAHVLASQEVQSQRLRFETVEAAIASIERLIGVAVDKPWVRMPTPGAVPRPGNPDDGATIPPTEHS